MKAKKALNNFQLRTELIPDPRKYTALPYLHPPTNREIIVKEKNLTFEQYLSSLNIFKCSVCMKCKIESKSLVGDPNYICSKYSTRKDLDVFLRNNFVTRCGTLLMVTGITCLTQKGPKFCHITFQRS